MTTSEPRPPVDIFRDAVPIPMIQRRGDRERGPHAWEAWVQYGPMRYAHEYGTYAWSEKGARRKARRLLRSFQHSNPSKPPVQVN